MQSMQEMMQAYAAAGASSRNDGQGHFAAMLASMGGGCNPLAASGGGCNPLAAMGGGGCNPLAAVDSAAYNPLASAGGGGYNPLAALGCGGLNPLAAMGGGGGMIGTNLPHNSFAAFVNSRKKLDLTEMSTLTPPALIGNAGGAGGMIGGTGGASGMPGMAGIAGGTSSAAEKIGGGGIHTADTANVDPDLLAGVRDFIQKWELDDYFEGRMLEPLRDRTTWKEDLESLTETLGNARNPAGLLSAKLKEMREGTFEAKGSKGGGKGGSGGGGKGGGKPGDWECPTCGHNVFASKMECFKCGTAKPRGDSGTVDLQDSQLDDIHDMCKKYDIDDRMEQRVAEALSKRKDTFNEDLRSLDDTLANARNPPGLLSVKLREMDDGTFVAKASGKGKGQRDRDRDDGGRRDSGGNRGYDRRRSESRGRRRNRSDSRRTRRGRSDSRRRSRSNRDRGRNRDRDRDRDRYRD